MRLLPLAKVLLLSLIPLVHGLGFPRQTSDTDFDWTKVEPKASLAWQSCYGTRECTRFMVPLDWKNPDGEKAAIALIRIRSPLGSEHKDYLGPLIVNPGGPGGSGINLVLAEADRLATFLGPRFDFVGLDPRGVGFTTPRTSLYPTCEDRVSGTQGPVVDIGSTEEALGKLWAEHHVRGQFAEAQNSVALKHVTTASVAHDILAISTAYGYEKVRYFGFSYGTVLGATFAAMFPNNVERFVLDGVMDADNYYNTLWNKNLETADKALVWLFDACHEAGPKECAFYEETPALIERSYKELLESLRTHPIPAFTPATASSPARGGVVDYSLIKSTMLESLYSPSSWPFVAQVLAELKQGNATLALQRAQTRDVCGCGENPVYDNTMEAQLAIMCTDGAPVEDTVDELKEFYVAVNSSFSGVFLSRLECAGWKIRPDDHFTGPFTANTSFPMLWVGNTADPVTPVSNAHKMAKGFPGSVVLTQNSPGHPSTAVLSSCTLGHIGSYFVDGTLPAVGTVCEMDGPIFPVG